MPSPPTPWGLLSLPPNDEKRVFKSSMAVGNAESITNGVGGIEVQARQFRNSDMNENLRVPIFHPLSPVIPLRFVPSCYFLFSTLSDKVFVQQ